MQSRKFSQLVKMSKSGNVPIPAPVKYMVGFQPEQYVKVTYNIGDDYVTITQPTKMELIELKDQLEHYQPNKLSELSTLYYYMIHSLSEIDKIRDEIIESNQELTKKINQLEKELKKINKTSNQKENIK